MTTTCNISNESGRNSSSSCDWYWYYAMRPRMSGRLRCLRAVHYTLRYGFVIKIAGFYERGREKVGFGGVAGAG